MKKIEHIGIAVSNIKKSKEIFDKLFQKTEYKKEIVESEKVATSFYQVGETKIELLEASNKNSTIAKYIDKKGEGIHHLAFDVDDIYKEIERLKKLGFQFILDNPKKGADNKIITFIHPKSANGILIELCQEIKN